MIELPDYRIIAEIYAGRSLILRAVREKDQTPVIVKLMQQEYPAPEEKARFRSEYELLRSIESDSVIKPFDLVTSGNGFAIVMEDFGGIDLKALLSDTPLSLEHRFDIAVRLCDIIDDLHSNRVIHKDINPSNFVINPDENQVKLIDFGLSTRFSRQEPSLANPETVEGTLAYISPEQTGRMNRRIDYRSDYYSFGVTLYELFAGQLPFTTSDRISLFHCHMAKVPPPMEKVDPQIPRVLTRIVSKMMDKNAEDRYQSIKGLKHDLIQCRYQLKTFGTIKRFTIAAKDFPDRLSIPERIFAREDQVESMLKRFSNACSGRPGFSLVSGPAGIGKSVLINELKRPVTDKNGWFAFGKFDQYQQDMPYQAFVTAFSRLLGQVILSGPEKNDHWRDKIRWALGKNAKLITDLFADLGDLIGKPPEVPPLAAMEAVHRFENTLRRFISVFISKKHPLVLFLDDLQWADAASLSLLMQLHKAPDIRHFYLIAAFRDDDEYISANLKLFLDELSEYKVLVERIRVQPFSPRETADYVAGVLSCDPAALTPLAGIIHQKTRGNPFYINQFLMALNEDEKLVFNRKKEQWQWEMAAIEAESITSNVADLLGRKIKKMDPLVRHTLATAACLGSHFDTALVSKTAALLPQKADQHLRTAEKAGLISAFETPAASGFDFINIRYRFVHDRVQQAAWSSLNPNELLSMHLTIGRLLAKEAAQSNREIRIFDIVGHYNQALDRITDSLERKEVLALNLAAGQKAKSANAFASATRFLTQACELLEENCWQNDYQNALLVHNHAMEAACLAGYYEQMDDYGELIFKNAQNLTDQAFAIQIVINSLIARNRTEQSVLYALGFLKKLGVNIPEKPGKLQTLGAILLPMIRLRTENGMARLGMKKQLDPKTLARLNILSMIISPAYFSTPELLPVLIGRHLQLSLQHGYSPAVGYVVVTLGIILCGFFGWIDTGYRLGRKGLELAQKDAGREFEARAMFGFHCLIQHWKEYGQNTVAPILEGCKKALRSGDLEHAALCIVFDAYHAYLMGMELGRLEKKYRENSRQIEQMNQKKHLLFARIFHQTVHNLTGRSSDPTKLCGEYVDEDRILPELEAAKDWSAYHSVHFNKLILCTLFGEFKQGLDSADKAEKTIESSAGTMNPPVFYFYDAVCRLSLYAESSQTRQRRMVRKAVKGRQKLKKWAAHSPRNYLHRLYLVEAELAAASDNFEMAASFYDKAVHLAGKNGFIQDQALANERAAAFYGTKDKTAISRMYLKEAWFCYRKWGALKKVELLEKQHRILSPVLMKGGTTENGTGPGTFSEGSSTHGAAIDLESLFRASRVISGELSLKKLLKKMMQLVLETAGAQHGCLFLNDRNRLFLEAETTDEKGIEVLMHQPLDQQVCTESRILNHVVRTRQLICIDDLESQEMFHPLEEGKRPIPKSLLCLPLIARDTLVGLLHLTNNLARGVFSPDRVEVLNILSSTIAVSLENARLYREVQQTNLTLEQKVMERTKELERLARTDPLTKLPNRRSLMETIEYEKSRCTRKKKTFALVLSDIDNFKMINDTHGHGCGDYVLFHTAQLLRSCLRDQDTVARWGGEEFLFLLPDTDESGSRHLAEKIRQAIESESFVYNDTQVPVTMTFGISLFDSTVGIDDCIRVADEKMYQGKQTGKNKVVA